MEINKATKADISLRVRAICPCCKGNINVQWYVEQRREKTPEEREKYTFQKSCNDCDSNYQFSFEGDELMMVSIAPKSLQGMMLVKRPNQELYLVVEQTFYIREGVVDLDFEYWVNDSTCPTNWLDVMMIAEDGDDDPHGVFEFVRAVTYKDVQERLGITRATLRGMMDSDKAINVVFPEIREGGTVVEGVVERQPAVLDAPQCCITHSEGS